MTKLHEELGQCLIRAGLHGAMGTAQFLSQGRRCSWAHSSSKAGSPWAESGRKEVAKWPRGDSMQGTHSLASDTVGTVCGRT